MSLVTNKNDLIKNIKVFEDYLCEGTEDDLIYCKQIIKKGICFVAYKVGEGTRFVPSRYIGYKNNTPENHKKREKNGEETTPAINKILKTISTDSELENHYQEYCRSLGILPHNRRRKFWKLDFKDIKPSILLNQGDEFPEGEIIERIHRTRERNSKLIKEAKKAFKKTHNRLYCEACKFDFEKKYGSRGKDYIEGHHNIPVSEMKRNQKSSIDDISMVCSNCHKIIHRTRPWLSVNDLHLLITEAE